LEDVNLSRAGLADEEAPALVEQLSKFPALKRLDVSTNPGLRLLPIGMLRIAATLEAFKCDGCSLVLPPQSMFSTPEENPRRIQELLCKGSSEIDLNLSAAELASIVAHEVSALLPLYPALKRLDVSDNPALSCTGAAVMLSALSGEIMLDAESFVQLFSCDLFFTGDDAAALEVVNMSKTGLADEEAPALVEQLSKFPALKRLDVSANPGLRLLPIGMLRIAATLEAYNCDGCSLVLPPQSMFSTPEENPRRIQQLLDHGVLKLSAAKLASNTAREVAALLRLYPALKRLDVSDNPGMRCTGAAVILSALSGMLPCEADSFVAVLLTRLLTHRCWCSCFGRCQSVENRPCG
jgi:Leucine-rich repeat (LRR) protein